MDQVPAHHNRFPIGKSILIITSLVIFIAWLIFAPGGLLGKADAVGYAVCHRIEARSFFIGDRPTPLCARCSGMYLGMLLGILFQIRRGKLSRIPPLKILLPLSLFFIAFGVDGLNSYLHFFPQAPSLYEPQNWLRLATGTGLGILVGMILLPVFHQTMWLESEDQPAFGSWKQVLPMIAAAVMVNLSVLSENPLLLYPLALLSSATVLLILGMCYSLVWVIAFKRENAYADWKDAWVPLLAGLTTAVIQIGLVDLLRLYFTGTWAGFNL